MAPQRRDLLGGAGDVNGERGSCGVAGGVRRGARDRRVADREQAPGRRSARQRRRGIGVVADGHGVAGDGASRPRRVDGHRGGHDDRRRRGVARLLELERVHVDLEVTVPVVRVDDPVPVDVVQVLPGSPAGDVEDLVGRVVPELDVVEPAREVVHGHELPADVRVGLVAGEGEMLLGAGAEVVQVDVAVARAIALVDDLRTGDVGAALVGGRGIGDLRGRPGRPVVGPDVAGAARGAALPGDAAAADGRLVVDVSVIRDPPLLAGGEVHRVDLHSCRRGRPPRRRGRR